MIWLNPTEARTAMRVGKMPRNVDWYGGFVGLFLCVALWIFSTLLVFVESSHNNRLQAIPAFIALSFLSSYGFYCLFKERELILLETGLNLVGNRKLTESAIKQLGWNILQNNKHVIQAVIPNKRFETSRIITVLIENNILFLNTMNLGSGKGRFPFFLSGSREQTGLFIRTAKKLNRV